MVVFTCNNCGDSLQKPKVAKHYQFHCRKAASLTCVDCLKDFLGDEYISHTKCMTEAERYGGKNYTPKASANKGERKQQEWMNIINRICDNITNLTQDEQYLLSQMKNYDNVPRKKAKFFNFVKSAFGYKYKTDVIESIWSKIETSSKEILESQKLINNSNSNSQVNPKDSDETAVTNGNHSEVNTTDMNKSVENGDDKGSKAKKSKKRKSEIKAEALEENSDDKTPQDANGVDDSPTKKLKKIKLEENDANDTIDQSVSDDSDEKKMSFDWSAVIVETLGTKEEMSLKKLKKKVVSKYIEYSQRILSDKASNKFDKKVKEISGIILDNNIVKKST